MTDFIDRSASALTQPASVNRHAACRRRHGDPMLSACSACPTPRLLRSVLPMSEAVNWPRRSSCVGTSRATTALPRRGNTPASSPAGSRCRSCRQNVCGGHLARWHNRCRGLPLPPARGNARHATGGRRGRADLAQSALLAASRWRRAINSRVSRSMALDDRIAATMALAAHRRCRAALVSAGIFRVPPGSKRLKRSRARRGLARKPACQLVIRAGAGAGGVAGRFPKTATPPARARKTAEPVNLRCAYPESMPCMLAAMRRSA